MSSTPLSHGSECQICDSQKIEQVYRLTPTPLEDQFVPSSHPVQKEFPMGLLMCKNCGYMFLDELVSPTESYQDYLYQSQVTVGLTEHYLNYAKEVLEERNTSQNSLVVDIGSNDGSGLKGFQAMGMSVLGIEPGGPPAKSALDAGIPTINKFFNRESADQIKQEKGLAKVVTANYMFANIPDLHDFLNNVKHILEDEGYFYIQTGYHPLQFQQRMFDYIYHEHYSYFTLNSLKILLERNNLNLISVKTLPYKGGSIRVCATSVMNKQSCRDESIDELLEWEKKHGYLLPETYKHIFTSVNQAKQELLYHLELLKKEELQICGYGASHSTTTLIYHFDLASHLDFIVDDNIIKHGLESPGKRIEVKSREVLMGDEAPKYVLVLAWQHWKTIVKKNKEFVQAGGTFIVPLPHIQFLNKGNIECLLA